MSGSDFNNDFNSDFGPLAPIPGLQLNFGPVNITQGNSAFFTIEFADTAGNQILPMPATLSINYTNISNASQTDLVALSQRNSFLTGTWSSTNASRGLAPWTVTATGVSSVFQEGVIRVIDP